MMNKKLFFILSICFLLSSPLFSREKNVFPLFIEHVGKGSASIATAKDSRAVFFNPALISSVKDGFYLVDASFSNSKTVNEIFDDTEIIKNRIINSLGTEEALGYLSLGGPLYIGAKFLNIQIVFFNYAQMDFRAYGSATPSPGAYAEVSFYEDTGLAAGFSFPLPISISGSKWENLYWGFSLKFFQRVKGYNSQINLDTVSDMGDPFDFVNNQLNPGRALSFTSDFGLYYEYHNLSVSAVAYNVLSLPLEYKTVELPEIWKSSSDTTVYSESLNFELALGVAYTFNKISNIPSKFMKALIFSFEANDIFNQEEYPKLFQKIRMGVQVTLANSIEVRAGLLHESLTFGIGFSFWILKVDAAYWNEKIKDNKTTNLGMRLAIEF